MRRIYGQWTSDNGETLSVKVSDWAPNEPSVAGGDCAVADRSLGCEYSSNNRTRRSSTYDRHMFLNSFSYKWRSASCTAPNMASICTVRKPYCPLGYEWIPNAGQSCFKVVEAAYQTYEYRTIHWVEANLGPNIFYVFFFQFRSASKL